MLHSRDGIGQVMSSAWFPPDVTLGIQAKEFNLGLISLFCVLFQITSNQFNLKQVDSNQVTERSQG
jgi:hypothetical protein